MSLETIDPRRLGLRAGQRLLDIGCGEGRHVIAAAYRDQLDAVGIDLDAADLATARTRAAELATPGRVHLIRASGLRLPFADAAFDRVICSEVLEHIADYQSVLREAARVLKEGGRLAVSVPRYTPEAICWQLSQDYYTEEGGHLRIFETAALRAAIESEGFLCYDRHYAHALHTPYWWLRCALGKDSEQSWPVRLYHDLLVWDLMRSPPLTRAAEALLNPLIGKSAVLYFVKVPA